MQKSGFFKWNIILSLCYFLELYIYVQVSRPRIEHEILLLSALHKGSLYAWCWARDGLLSRATGTVTPVDNSKVLA